MAAWVIERVLAVDAPFESESGEVDDHSDAGGRSWRPMIVEDATLKIVACDASAVIIVSDLESPRREQSILPNTGYIMKSRTEFLV